MKIRNKITLWIAGPALLSTIIFSSVIFFELTKESFKFIDKEMQYMVQPIENFEEELYALIRFILIRLLICILIIIMLLSHKLAGKILRPVADITRMAREISEKSLYRRIPVSKNQDELQELALSLNKMFDRLQYSFNRQREIIGNASHELKSPITLLMLPQ